MSHRACSFSLLYINCGRFGFVEFSSPDDAASAYDTMQNAEIDGRTGVPGLCLSRYVSVV